MTLTMKNPNNADMSDIHISWQQQGFTEGNEDVPVSIQYLKGHMAVFPAFFNGLPEERLLYRAGPGKWSRKEILGHLVDSAVHNLTRFTAIPFAPSPYEVRPYRQVELVRINRYQELPLSHLLVLWEGLNRQILFVIEGLSPEQLSLSVKPGYADQATHTLGWVFCDYVAHLEHHLRQVYARD